MSNPAQLPPLSPDEQAQRAQFIRRWGIWRFGLPTGVAWSILFFWMQHRANFRWAMLWSIDYLVVLVVGLAGFGWYVGRWWGGRIYDSMRQLGRRPPDE